MLRLVPRQPRIATTPAALSPQRHLHRRGLPDTLRLSRAAPEPLHQHLLAEIHPLRLRLRHRGLHRRADGVHNPVQWRQGCRRRDSRAGTSVRPRAVD